jgi:hypothetical protein
MSDGVTVTEEAREIFPVSFEEDLGDLDFRPQPVDADMPEVEDPKDLSALESVDFSASPTDVQPEQIVPSSSGSQNPEPALETVAPAETAAVAKDSTSPRGTAPSMQPGSRRTRAGSSTPPAPVEVPPIPESPIPGFPNEDKPI